MPFCDMFFIELHITKVRQTKGVYLLLEKQVDSKWVKSSGFYSVRFTRVIVTLEIFK